MRQLLLNKFYCAVILWHFYNQVLRNAAVSRDYKTSQGKIMLKFIDDQYII